MNRELCFHYTNVEGAAAIVNSCSLWFSHPMSLNDSNELVRALESVYHKLGLQPWRNWQDLCSICAVFSMSKSADILSQWKGYADNCQGVAIGIAPDIFIAAEDRVTTCVYNQAEHEQTIDEVCKEFGDYLRDFEATPTDRVHLRFRDDELFEIASRLLTIKNAAFAEEQEVRVITKVASKSDWKFRVQNGVAACYVERSIRCWPDSHGSSDMYLERGFVFPHIVFGPKCDERNRHIFDWLLDRWGTTDDFDCGYR